MYSRDKSRRNHKNEPSFSSIVLDEIYRSLDENAENTEDSNFLYGNNKMVKKQGDFRGNGHYGSSHSVADEEMAGFRRACLVDKWLGKEENHKFLTESENKPFQDKDLSFFSSNSSSSDSSGALSSSSDTEFFSSTMKSRVSCFSYVARPKPVRVGGKNRQEDGLTSFDDYKCHQKNGMEDDLFKSKSRALKIYANLRKVKQPISPGGKLTSFINSLFNHANGKKLKNVDSGKGIQVQDLKSTKTSSDCSSASSFSRSCLSKDSPKSREKMGNGIQRTVRFDPVSVVFNEEPRPCRFKSKNGEDSERFERVNQFDDVKFSQRVKNKKVEEATQKVSRVNDIYGFRKSSKIRGEDEEDNDDDDAISDSSSDLFELDHLSSFGNSRFREELPVYETTHYDTNRAIASGLIR